MDITIDRSLPVTISAQLQGQIEYGIAFGTIPAGSQLPSTRKLASQLNISPVTVSHVYKALRHKGLLESQHGSGTYVRDNVILTDRSARQLAAIHEIIDHLLQSADKYGISRTELKRIINLRLEPSQLIAQKTPLRLVFVGNFLDATHSYVTELGQYLMPGDVMTATTLERLKSNADKREEVLHADAVITLAHRVGEVRKLLRDGTPIALLDFMPSERTRTALAELSPSTRTGLISAYPEFLSSLKSMVLSFAPHVHVMNAAVPGSPQLQNVLNYSDVVIYTTGSETSLSGIPQHVRAIEFRYVPDPRSIKQDLLPLLESVRRKAEQPSQHVAAD